MPILSRATLDPARRCATDAYSDGNVWYPSTGTDTTFGAMTPNGKIAKFFSESYGPVGGLDGGVNGPDGNLWFTGTFATPPAIWSVSLTGTINRYIEPNGQEPYMITVGPDRQLWFTDLTGSFIASVSTTGAFTEYSTDVGMSPAAAPRGIVTGSDGNMSSRPRELHPQPLTERCVNLSIHTALIKQTNLLSHFPSAQTNSAVA